MILLLGYKIEYLQTQELDFKVSAYTSPLNIKAQSII